jgi:hypothetical protein
MQTPTIAQPHKPTEFEIQAELYSKLKTHGFNVRGEVRAKNQGLKSQFDLVVFHGCDAAVIIEVKDSPCLGLLNGKKTRQSEKYHAYGIPVLFHTSVSSVSETIAKVQALLG